MIYLLNIQTIYNIETFQSNLLPAKIHNSHLYFIHIPKNAGTSFITQYCHNNQVGHLKAKDIDDINIIKNTVAIIRNPYDRLHSIYEYTKLGKNKSYWDANEKLHKYMLNHSFSEFIDDLYSKTIKFTDQVHLPPQTDFVKWHDGNIYTQLVNFDTMENDLSNILGYKVILKKINSSNKKNWESFYNEDMKKKVYEIYKSDFELYNNLI